MISIIVPGVITDPTVPVLYRDELISGAGSAVRFLIDLANEASFPAQSNPTSGDQVYDLSNHGITSSFVVTGAVAPTFSGGGVHFTNVAAKPTSIVVPSTVGSYFWNGGVNRHFLSCIYLKLNTVGNWLAAAGLRTFTNMGSAAYTTDGKGMVLFGEQTGTLIAVRRIRGINIADLLTVSGTVHAGLVAQVAAWWNGSTLQARVKSSGGTSAPSSVASTLNSVVEFSDNTNIGIAGTLNAPPSAGTGWGIYRAFLEDTAVSGRNPITVLDDDYTRNISRFS